MLNLINKIENKIGDSNPTKDQKQPKATIGLNTAKEYIYEIAL